MRSVSKGPSFSALMSGQGILCERIELAGSYVLLNLKIPGVRVVAVEPVSKRLETGLIQLFDFALQQLNLGHGMSLP